ncbi:MAG: hypothetical protein AB1651_12595 [Pseudomonadota bacterium]
MLHRFAEQAREEALCFPLRPLYPPRGGDEGTPPRPARRAPEAVFIGIGALSHGTHDLVDVEGMLEAFAVHGTYWLMRRHMHVMVNGLGWKPLVAPSDQEAADR